MNYPLTLRQLEIFSQVAKFLSITRASEELHLTQPAVSMQVKQIEHLINLPLLERAGKKLFLTEAGHIIKEYANNILASQKILGENLNAISGAETGHLNLAVPETATQFVTLLLAQFLKLHPGISFHLQIHNRAGLLRQLSENSTDLVIMGQTPVELKLVTKSFMKNPLVIIAPPKHHLSEKYEISLSKLMENEFVVREEGSGTRIAMQKFFEEHGVKLKTFMEMPNNEAIKHAVVAGLGLGIVSLHTLQQELALKQVKILKIQKMPIMRIWYIVHHQQKMLSPAMMKFKEFVIQNTQKIWITKYPQLNDLL